MSILTITQINIEVILIIMCVLIYIITQIGERENKKAYQRIWIIDLLTIGLLLADVLALYYRGNETLLGYYMVRISNFFSFAFLYGSVLYTCFFTEYLFEYPKKGKKRILIAKIAAGLAFFINILNVFVPITYSFDEHNKYFRLNGWYVASIALVVTILLMTSVVIELRKEFSEVVVFMLLVDILIPLVASIVQIMIYGIAITTMSFGFTQIFLFLVLYQAQVKKIKEKEVMLEEYNAKLMLTQLQPHFMLNTLATIQYLCKTDSETAYNTIADFGVYLRNNMEFATSTAPITFEKELSHIEKYVSIEKQRFGERINVEYDIKERDFEIPALSVQPLLENAIKHGISKKRKGGTVKLSTWKEGKAIHVRVEDDGKGFDQNAPFSSDRVHLGLSLVESRLKRVCNGTLQIHSVPDQGTTCEIIIPVEL